MKLHRGYKLAIIFCVLFANLFYIVSPINKPSQSDVARAAWYNSDPSWPYRQKFTIVNPGSEIADYQLLLSEDIIARWKMDEGENTSVGDLSGYSLNGTIVGLDAGIAWTTSGKYNSALEFSGDSNSYVASSNDSMLTPVNNTLTLSSWINTSSSGQGRIISKGMDSSYTKGYMLEINNGYIYAGIGSGTESTSLLAKTTSTYNDGSWHHVVATFNRSSTKAIIYIDSSKAAIEAATGTCGSVSSSELNFSDCATDISLNSPNNLYLGRLDSAASYPFNGKIDETRIFNKALTATEISYLYNNNASPVLQKDIYALSLSDGSDVRFTSSDGSTSIPFYIEKYSANGQNARIWVKIPLVATGPTTTDFYLYYGNSSATTSSNYGNTFSNNDDFSDNSLSASWTLTSDGSGSISEAGGNLDFSYSGTSTDWWTDPTNRQVNILKYNTVPTYDFWAQIKLLSYTSNNDTMAGIGVYGDDANSYLFGRSQTSTKNNYSLEKIGTHDMASVTTTTMPAWLAISNTASGYSFWLSYDSLSWQKVAGNYSDITLNNIMLFGKTSTSGLDFSMDDFMIRKYAASAPTVTISGNYENPVAELEFTIEGVGADTTHNGVTTSVGSSYNSIAFGKIELATPKYAAHKLTVISNGVSGYSVKVKLDGYIQGIYPANKLDPFAATNVSWTTPQSWSMPNGTEANTDSGWVGANTSDTRVTGWESDTSGKFGPLSSTAHEVMKSADHDSGTSAYVSYAIEVSHLQPPDIYSGTLVYSIVPTY